MPGKSTVAEIEARVDAVFDLLTSGADYKAILRYASTEAKWDVTSRQVDYYIKKATERYVELAQPDREAAFGRALARRHDLFLKCKKVQDYKTCLAIDRDLAELLGLYPPKRMQTELTGAGGGPVQVAWPEVRVAILTALGPYPDARAAVAAALISLENSNHGPGPGPRPCARPAEVDDPGEASA